MLKLEYKICSKCNKMYPCVSGGVVMTPHDYNVFGLCEKCRLKVAKNFIAKILGRGIKR